MKRILSVTLGFCLLGVGTLGWAQPAYSCPSCTKALDENEDGTLGNPALAYSASVIFMLSMPFLLTAGFATAFYRLHRLSQQMTNDEATVLSRSPDRDIESTEGLREV